ncbi:uncharacterized protein LOC116955847 [Petromyzon marinus]|uniref:uncharacterized protein LOC116955847 n=1 Tax=Petromyzon marinus TaxID=7757 RepID=UPI003F72A955
MAVSDRAMKRSPSSTSSSSSSSQKTASEPTPSTSNAAAAPGAAARAAAGAAAAGGGKSSHHRLGKSKLAVPAAEYRPEHRSVSLGRIYRAPVAAAATPGDADAGGHRHRRLLPPGPGPLDARGRPLVRRRTAGVGEGAVAVASGGPVKAVKPYGGPAAAAAAAAMPVAGEEEEEEGRGERRGKLRASTGDEKRRGGGVGGGFGCAVGSGGAVGGARTSGTASVPRGHERLAAAAAATTVTLITALGGVTPAGPVVIIAGASLASPETDGDSSSSSSSSWSISSDDSPTRPSGTNSGGVAGHGGARARRRRRRRRGECAESDEVGKGVGRLSLSLLQQQQQRKKQQEEEEERQQQEKQEQQERQQRKKRQQMEEKKQELIQQKQQLEKRQQKQLKQQKQQQKQHRLSPNGFCGEEIDEEEEVDDDKSEDGGGGGGGGGGRQVQFSAKSGLTGLENLGNTCFVNSIVQCLSHTRALRDYCVCGDYESETNPHSPTKGALAHAFALLLRELWSGGSVARPSSLLTQVQRHAPRFGGGSQHDAQEFLLFLLDGLHHDVNRSSPRAHPLIHDLDHLSDKEKSMKQWKSYLERDNSKIVDLFVGQLKSTLTCLHCGLHSTTFDAFWSLPLPVAKRPLSDPSLQECVRLFAKEETLDGDERPHCPRCQCKRRSGKRLSLQRLPRLLVLFLKRFSEPASHHHLPPSSSSSSSLLPPPPPPPPGRGRAGSGGAGGGGAGGGAGGAGASKLTAPVNYPLRGLDLTAYTTESNACALYDLYAVSLHSGSMQCGHYVSLCRHAQSGSWYLYNDTSVTEVPESRVVSSDAYILFYELCGSNTHV